jgi:hypothetical protein
METERRQVWAQREVAWCVDASFARARQHQPRRKVVLSDDGLRAGKRAGSWPPCLFRASFVWGSGGGRVGLSMVCYFSMLAIDRALRYVRLFLSLYAQRAISTPWTAFR